ncbi:MAG: VIT family protein [Cyanobacteria bacterium K_Offshore_surface_m2_239]|nr:VIT family protein [Cyanobacteria bacterium K_Offshore_surface_m2_239]
MSLLHRHFERHATHRVGWLRAVVLGANDGAISVASLVVGIAASGATRPAVLLSGLAATVAGAASMAAGEFVSVQSQADVEQADLARERQELVANPSGELEELTGIYEERGLSPELARQVAEQLSLHDALGAHARDELGITEALRARPIQAALASAGSFCLGALCPVLMILLSPAGQIAQVTAAMALLVLTGLGALAAYAGGAPVGRGAGRMLLWGALALGLTALVGKVFGAVV